MTFLLLTPAIVQSNSDYSNVERSYITSAEAILPPVSYVWQEINGFCAWAATAMAMQYAGADVSLYDVFAASSIGFSFAYFHINDTMLMIPGSLYTQAQPTHYLAGLYGIDYTLYVDTSIPNFEQNVQVWENEGLTIGVTDGEDEAFDLMRDTIDSGYPLLVSVDPSWLPAADYDILRAEGLSGGGHAILLVGYNDTEHSVTYLDPGVGSFGDDYGYPEDGRGNYTMITYTALNNAWSNRFYISNTFIPNGDAPVVVDDSLGPLIRDKLLGVGAIYSPSGPTPCVVSEQMVKEMKSNSVIIDVSIDQGGCVETSRRTTHKNPVLKKYDVIHYCVSNIASRVPHTASYALSNFFAPLILNMGETGGPENLIRSDRHLCHGVYLFKGILSNKYISDLFDLPFQELDLLLAAFD